MKAQVSVKARVTKGVVVIARDTRSAVVKAHVTWGTSEST